MPCRPTPFPQAPPVAEPVAWKRARRTFFTCGKGRYRWKRQRNGCWIPETSGSRPGASTIDERTRSSHEPGRNRAPTCPANGRRGVVHSTQRVSARFSWLFPHHNGSVQQTPGDTARRQREARAASRTLPSIRRSLPSLYRARQPVRRQKSPGCQWYAGSSGDRGPYLFVRLSRGGNPGHAHCLRVDTVEAGGLILWQDRSRSAPVSRAGSAFHHCRDTGSRRRRRWWCRPERPGIFRWRRS